MADPRRHPDVETLDGYADGDHSSLDVDRHVRECAACQDVVNALRRVRTDLAGLAQVTMPADVATRIQAALEAENSAAGRYGAGRMRGIPGAPGTFRRTGPGRRRRARAFDLLAVAAACLVALVVVAGVFAARESSRDAETTAAGSAAAPAENYALPPTASGQDGSGGAGRANEPVPADGRAGTGPAVPAPPSALPTPAPRAALQAPVAVATSDITISDSGLDRHANDLLTGRVAAQQVHLGGPDPLDAPALPPAPDVPSNMQTRAAVRELVSPSLVTCYRTLTNYNGGTVLALDRVRFGGQPSVFVILSVPDTPGAVHVWIINIDCGTAGTAMAQRGDKIVLRS